MVLEIQALAERAAARARYYMAEGFEKEKAIDLAVEEETRGLVVRGLGDDLLQEAQSTVKSVSSVVSPWLWILSIIGFAMGMANKYQIQKMYGSWKRAKRKLLR